MTADQVSGTRRPPQADAWGLIGLLLLAYAVTLMVRTGWVSDDAYITLRTVHNFLHGYGLRWNVDERVQVYTHPLWMLLLTAVCAVTRATYLPTIALGIATSCAGLLLVLRRMPGHALGGVLIVCGLLSSKAFIDFSTGGLENPLAHLLAILFFIDLARFNDRPLDFLRLSLWTSLSATTRLDSVLIYFPVMTYLLVRRHDRLAVRAVLLGSAPLLLWLLFALFYYGTPLPNTFFAKVGNEVPTRLLLEQGFYYYLNSLNFDPLTLTLILAGIGAGVVSRMPKRMGFALGILFYLVYILAIGGDFMSGRFFTLPLVCSLMLLASARQWTSGTQIGAAIVLIIGIGLTTPYSPLQSRTDYAERPMATYDVSAIADERKVYYSASGLLLRTQQFHPPINIMMNWGYELRDKAEISGREYAQFTAIGYAGFGAGPRVHIIDLISLSDPFLVHMPLAPFDAFRLAHMNRTVPTDYLPSLKAGRNLFKDPELAEFFDQIQLITRGPIFGMERLRAVVCFNLGGCDALLKRIHDKYETDPGEILINDISSRVEPGAADQRKRHLIPPQGLSIKLDTIMQAHGLILETSPNGIAEIVLSQNELSTTSLTIPVDPSAQSPLAGLRIAIPPDARAQGVTALRLIPRSGQPNPFVAFLGFE